MGKGGGCGRVRFGNLQNDVGERLDPREGWLGKELWPICGIRSWRNALADLPSAPGA